MNHAIERTRKFQRGFSALHKQVTRRRCRGCRRYTDTTASLQRFLPLNILGAKQHLHHRLPPNPSNAHANNTMASVLQHSDDDVRHVLSQDAHSVSLHTLGVKRVDAAQLPANNPCEDRYNLSQSLTVWEGESWVASTIFDGHYGWQTADHLEKELLKAVQAKLNKLQWDSRTDQSIQHAIETAFEELDDSIIRGYVDCARNKDMALEHKVPYMEVAMAGSCALLVLYNPKTKTIYTACTGDSRAVLGKQTADGMWEPLALSEDQTGATESEVARLRKEHPNEEVITHGNRVLGLAISRAFGNFPWKSSHEVQEELGKRFIQGKPKEKTEIPTPPYLIAKPVVTITKLEAEQPAFLILASDGIWDNFENYEAVELVVRWLEAQPESNLEEMKMKLKITPETAWWKREPQAEADYPAGFDFLERWNDFDIRFRQERAVIEDLDNVAVHLLRNACGANHRELLRGRLAYRPPFARDVRDDMTVQVLFF